MTGTETGTVAVLGAGTVGRGIATVAVRAGFDTTIVDVDPVVLASACEAVDPAHRMALVEIVIGDVTTDRTVADARAFAEALGKQPVLVRDVPGFLTSRLGLLLGNEAMRMVEDGVASAEDVDKAMRLGYGHPMGPLELADLVGLDARLNNVRSMWARTGSLGYRPPGILERLVAEGRLGRKSGAGFYRYDESGRRIT